ncbi:hypothetical protein ACFXKS_27025 [Streptomyces scopuliridis]|uniref:hypothetical protein n=1 Tax=Streptomyces scopuliridis TaxID=452529 RepID=UPI0036BD997E
MAFAQGSAPSQGGSAASMQLNRVPDEDRPPAPLPGGSTPNLASTPAQKSAAANTIETELQPNTKKAGDWADASMTSAISAFSGWATATGLKTVQTTWESQVKTLVGRLNMEKGALRATVTIFTQTDVDRRGTISGIPSNFDKY